MNDKFFIAKAIALATKGKFNTKPGVKVGSIIVKNQKIIGQGYYKGFGGPHAEINAINEVKKKYKKNFILQSVLKTHFFGTRTTKKLDLFH